MIEVKSKLDSKELDASLEKASKVKKMSRKGIAREQNEGGLVEPFCAIFAYESIDLKLIKKQLEERYNTVPLNERIDFIVVLGLGLIFTGHYFEVVKYGQENSEYRRQLGKEGIEEIKKQYPSEIAGMFLKDDTFMIWYLYTMVFLSFSKSRVSNFLDYLGPEKNWGEHF